MMSLCYITCGSGLDETINIPLHWAHNNNNNILKTKQCPELSHFDSQQKLWHLTCRVDRDHTLLEFNSFKIKKINKLWSVKCFYLLEIFWINMFVCFFGYFFFQVRFIMQFSPFFITYPGLLTYIILHKLLACTDFREMKHFCSLHFRVWRIKDELHANCSVCTP